MCSKRLFILVHLFLFMFAGELFAVELPPKAQRKPKVFDEDNNIVKSCTWEKIAEEKNWNELELSSKPWLVFVANDGAIAYESSSSLSKQLMRLDFMDEFYIAKLNGDYALLFYSKHKITNNLDIPSSCRKQCVKKANGVYEDGSVGWVKIDDLLLWRVCPQTEKGVYQKIVVVKDLEHITDRAQLERTPKLYKSEYCIGDTALPVSYLDFYFLFKRTSNGNALVCLNYKAGDKMHDEIIGWIEYGEYIKWNTRICWEVAFKEDDKIDLNDAAMTFSTLDYASKYDISNLRSKSKITKERKDSKFPRNPILNYDDKKRVAHLAVIGNLEGKGATDEERFRIHKLIDDMEKNMSSINIVFVMDATRSMERSFSEMRKALKDISMYRYNNKLTIKYGAVLFRNYEDERIGDLLEVENLTTNIETIANFLNGDKCRSVSDNVQEAMFRGLDRAVDLFENPREANFIILVSDVSSEIKGKYTQDYIIKRLAEKKVNLVAFQSAWNSKYGSDFGPQIKSIIQGLLRKVHYSDKRESINGVTYYIQDPKNDWPLRPMAYRIADEQNTKSEVLYDFTVNIIEDFIRKTESNILKMKSSVGVGSDNDIDHSVCEGLIRDSIITSCEQLKGPIKVNGYSKMYFSNQKQMFVPCVFMAEKELARFIDGLEIVVRNTSKDRRARLQEQCKDIILSYTGQLEIAERDKSAISDEEMDKIIESIETECGYSFYPDVKKHIHDSEILNEDDYRFLVKRLEEDIETLKMIQGEKPNQPQSSCISQNGMRYYYILLRDMPLVIKK